ncbi:hypothetical protein FKM82_005316 [Ascaphus truei]
MHRLYYCPLPSLQRQRPLLNTLGELECTWPEQSRKQTSIGVVLKCNTTRSLLELLFHFNVGSELKAAIRVAKFYLTLFEPCGVPVQDKHHSYTGAPHETLSPAMPGWENIATDRKLPAANQYI